MNRGHVEQVSVPEEVYDRPTTTFVAGFIGVSNLMPATVKSGNEVELDQGQTISTTTDGFSAGDRCHAVVRPEKLQVQLPENGAAPTDRPRVEGIVASSLYLGTATQIAVDLGEDVRMTVLVPNADEAERQRLPGGGAKVALSWEPEHMHLVRESPDAAAAESNDGASAADQSPLETTHGG
jgi:ABC-type Fe3+/spermidine/putrescine transport system ATPase subunit